MKAHFPKLCRNREPGTLLTVYNNCLIIDTDLKYLSFPESVAQREMNNKGSLLFPDFLSSSLRVLLVQHFCG